MGSVVVEHGLSCLNGMWDRTRDGTGGPCIGRQFLYHSESESESVSH